MSNPDKGISPQKEIQDYIKEVNEWYGSAENKLDSLGTSIFWSISYDHTGLPIAQIGYKNIFTSGALTDMHPDGEMVVPVNHIEFLNIPLTGTDLDQDYYTVELLTNVSESIRGKYEIYNILKKLQSENSSSLDLPSNEIIKLLNKRRFDLLPPLQKIAAQSNPQNYQNFFLDELNQALKIIEFDNNPKIFQELQEIIDAIKNPTNPFKSILFGPSEGSLRMLYLNIFNLEDSEYSTTDLMQANAVYLIAKRAGDKIDLTNVQALLNHPIRRELVVNVNLNGETIMTFELMRRLLGSETIIINRTKPNTPTQTPNPSPKPAKPKNPSTSSTGSYNKNDPDGTGEG